MAGQDLIADGVKQKLAYRLRMLVVLVYLFHKFYAAVAQAVLLFGAETWVVAPQILAALEGFYHRVARRITGLVGRQAHMAHGSIQRLRWR